MEYVHERSNQYDLIKTLGIWERKVEIAEVRDQRSNVDYSSTLKPFPCLFLHWL